jgi:hypothetical protein
MAFKAEELTTQIFPEGGEGWFACPENTVKGRPCPQNSRPQCPEQSVACPENTVPPKKPPVNATDLVLLQSQLRSRMAESPAAAF